MAHTGKRPAVEIPYHQYFKTYARSIWPPRPSKIPPKPRYYDALKPRSKNHD